MEQKRYYLLSRIKLFGFLLLTFTISALGYAGDILVVPKSSVRPVFTVPANASGKDLAAAFINAVPDLISFAHDVGLQKRISDQISDLSDRILNDIEYCSGGGILIIAKIEVIQTEAGPLFDLVGDSVDYVGIGSTPADAELANISRRPIRPGLRSNWKIDSNKSEAFWVSQNKDATLTVYHMPLAWLTRSTIGLYSKRKLEKFDWEQHRARVLEQMVQVAIRKVENTESKLAIENLEKSRRGALIELAAVNDKLKIELNRARRAADNAATLAAVGSALSLANAINMASRDMESADVKTLAGAHSNEELVKVLKEIEKASDSEAILLQQQLKTIELKSGDYEYKMLNILRTFGAPDNIPGSDEPMVPTLP